MKTRWQDTLDVQAEIATVWSGLRRRRGLDQRPPSVGKGDFFDSLLGFLPYLTEQVVPFWVSAEMVDLVTAVAPSIPEAYWTVTPPTVAGFVLFEEPRQTPSLEGGNPPTIAVAWADGGFIWETPTGGSVPARLVVGFCARDAVFPLGPPLGYPPVLVGWEWHWPLQVVEGKSRADAKPAGDFADNPFAAAEGRWLAALWCLMEQSIGVERREHPPRAVAKRWMRAGGDVAVVRVVTLRRAELSGKLRPSGMSRPVDWASRWLVGGHWRNQWYPHDSTHRIRWINPYVKGPEDKPLVVKDKVYALVR